MSWIKSAAIAIWLRAHSDLVFRGFVSLAIFWVINSIYVKYEAVLLVTNPEKLFIPLYIYTFILLGLIIWTLLSLRWVSGISAAKKKVEAQESFANKSDRYKKIADVASYPKLKSFKDKILSDE
tara:strand:- start:2805 stop:3176 length:372 start_codon:yes stop_codon:yes gene_type:complete